MFATVNGIGLFGMTSFAVTAEISAAEGVPGFEIIGLPDLAVQESKARVTSALLNSGIAMEPRRLIVNLAPASVKKTGSAYDLAILAAILTSQNRVKIDISKSVFIGELSLGGALLPVQGALTMAIAARKNGMSEIFLPLQNAREASVAEGIDVYGVKDVRELIQHLVKGDALKPETPYLPGADDHNVLFDYSDVRGQENVRKALETAAAGFHNILMIGAPGTGKSMLAKRLPSILPLMNFEESLETTQIHSIAGILDPNRPLLTARPFRAVGHTASSAGLIGGGSTPKPGEISLAHNGVLFLDELPEFDRRTLESLRQPLEDGEIHISRALGKSSYPCEFMLVAAMNPCPCGNFGHPTKNCACSDKQVNTYLGKISGPVLDRIDIQCEVAPVSYGEISTSARSENSSKMRERVEKAREIQTKRFAGTNIKVNSRIPPSMLHEICRADDNAANLLKNAFEKLGLSARAYDRVLKVARTVADLEGAEFIQKSHAAQAVQYRSLDKKYWKNRS